MTWLTLPVLALTLFSAACVNDQDALTQSVQAS